jgi:hypothetical protein
MHRVVVVAAVAVVTMACSSLSAGGDGGPQAVNAGNGVDDVKAACTIRASWTHSAESGCRDCILYSPVAPCSCSSDPNLGKCETQSQAQQHEADCTTALAVCVTDCITNCSCIDACYAGHDACRTVAAALDGCLVAACDSVCR